MENRQSFQSSTLLSVRTGNARRSVMTERSERMTEEAEERQI